MVIVLAAIILEKVFWKKTLLFICFLSGSEMVLESSSGHEYHENDCSLKDNQKSKLSLSIAPMTKPQGIQYLKNLALSHL